MATDPIRKPRESNLTPEQKARVEAIRAKNRTPEARAEEARVREILDREYRETGTIATTGDGTTMWDQVAFRRFVMGLRRERKAPGALTGRRGGARQDRQGGPEPIRERTTPQPHGEHAREVCPGTWQECDLWIGKRTRRSERHARFIRGKP